MIPLSGEVEAENAAVLSAGLGPDGVADGDEVVEGVVLGADMVKHKLDVLLIGEVV